MRVAIAGASGFIGGALRASLERAGHGVLTIGRGGGRAPDVVWDPTHRQLERSRLAECEAIVNLAGESLAQRWTDSARRRILDSRVDSTSLLAEAIAESATPPRVFVSGSAVGIYGDTGDREVDEHSAPGSGFLAEVVQRWEASAEPARRAGVRVVYPRMGVALHPSGGALAKMLLPFKLGAGGRIGTGQQWMAWVSLTDAVRALQWLLEHDTIAGPVNVVAPGQVRNAQFVEILARQLHRPAFAAMPAAAFTLLFGDMGRETLLAGQRVVPRVLQEAGFQFELPDLAPALRAEFASV